MIKKFAISLTVILFSFASFISAQNFVNKKQDLIIAKPKDSLNIGEKLEYSVEWLGIPVGIIILNTVGIEKINSKDCYHITANARPNRFFATFYDVEYTVHTYIDRQTQSSLRFEKTRRVRNQSSRVVIDFDRQRQEALSKEEGGAGSVILSPVRDRVEAKNPATTKILSGVQDLFSSFYQLRLMDIEAGGNYAINIYYNRRNWTVNFKIGEPFLRDIRKKGTLAVFGVAMDSQLSEAILGKPHIQVYLTADSRRIPIEFVFGVGLGAIHGKIQTNIGLPSLRRPAQGN